LQQSRSEETVKDARSVPRKRSKILDGFRSEGFPPVWPGSLKQSLGLFDFYPCRRCCRTPHAVCAEPAWRSYPIYNRAFIDPGALSGASNQSETYSPLWSNNFP